MTTVRKETSQTDVIPALLYAKTDPDSELAYPLLQSMFNPGFAIPKYDQIILGYSGSTLTSVVYYLSSVSVATLTLAYTGSNLTIVTRT